MIKHVANAATSHTRRRIAGVISSSSTTAATTITTRSITTAGLSSHGIRTSQSSGAAAPSSSPAAWMSSAFNHLRIPLHRPRRHLSTDAAASGDATDSTAKDVADKSFFDDLLADMAGDTTATGAGGASQQLRASDFVAASQSRHQQQDDADDFSDVLDATDPPLLPTEWLQRVDLDVIRSELSHNPIDKSLFVGHEEEWIGDYDGDDAAVDAGRDGKGRHGGRVFREDELSFMNEMTSTDRVDALTKRNIAYTGCKFCDRAFHKDGPSQIHFTNVKLLHSFTNARGMITTRTVNRNCAKHQRKMARSIKQARFLGLLGYINNEVADTTHRGLLDDDWDPTQLQAAHAEMLERTDSTTLAEASEKADSESAASSFILDKRDPLLSDDEAFVDEFAAVEAAIARMDAETTDTFSQRIMALEANNATDEEWTAFYDDLMQSSGVDATVASLPTSTKSAQLQARAAADARADKQAAEQAGHSEKQSEDGGEAEEEK